ncbi:hypothetical protein AAFF_G00370260, partial [Aldrovandia affinis]
MEDQKFGLTFQSPADAVSFEQGLRSAIDRLERESDSPSSSTPEEGDTEDDGQASHTGSESSSNSRKEMLPKPITIVTSESSSTCFVLPPAAEDYGYGTRQAVTTQTPVQVHIRPVQLQPSQSPAALGSSVPPPPTPPAAPPPLSPLSPTLSLLEQGDIKDLWGARGYEDYRRAESARICGDGGGSGSQDKSELCVVRFEKEQAGAGEVTVTLDAKAPQRLSSSSSPTSAPNAVATSPPASDSSKGSPSCCLHASRSRTRKR